MNPELVNWFASLRKYMQGNQRPNDPGQQMWGQGAYDMQTGHPVGLEQRRGPMDEDYSQGNLSAEQLADPYTIAQLKTNGYSRQRQQPLQRQALLEGMQSALSPRMMQGQ